MTKSYWFPVRSRGVYEPIEYSDDIYLNPKKWVSELDFAIKNHDRCETIMKTVLLSNETNGNDTTVFAVNNQGSKKLLDYIRKYFKEELDRREKELEEFKEQNNGIKN